MIDNQLESIENDRAILSVEIDPSNHLKQNQTSMRVDEPENLLTTLKNDSASSTISHHRPLSQEEDADQ